MAKKVVLAGACRTDVYKRQVDTEVLYQEEVTPEVLQSLDEEHAVLRSLKKTAVDNVVGHISLVYELVYPEKMCIRDRAGQHRQSLRQRQLQDLQSGLPGCYCRAE